MIDSLCQNLESLQCNLGEQLPNSAKEGDAMVVIADASVPLVFVEGDNVSVSHTLGYFAFLPVEAQDLMQFGDDGLSATLEDLGRNAIFFRCSAGGERVQGFTEIINHWFIV